MTKKKNIFIKAHDTIVHFFGYNQNKVEYVQKYHEKLLNQHGMDEFLKTMKDAKMINISIEKNYLPISPLFDIYSPYFTYKIDKYTIFRDGIYVDGKKTLKLDKKIFTMIENRAMELNPKEVKKVKKEIKENFGKRVYSLSKER